MVRLQAAVSEKMHAKLRADAYLRSKGAKRVSIAELIREALDLKYPEVEKKK